MYCLTEQQTDFILNDIRRRGVEMEDLQLNLLDHVCCIVEQNLKEGDDFENFYQKAIQQFFKRELWEIEEETITLLTFKNYYTMKKTMIWSGTISVVALLCGSFFKIMHWAGAGPMLLLGIATLSLVFLPLLFVLKARESQNMRDKMVAATGTLVGILVSLATLFKIMHWPGASFLWLATSAVSILVFIPLFFFSGIRKPETKMNTIITTIILIGGTGLLFSLTSVRKSKLVVFRETLAYYQDEQLLLKLQNKTDKTQRSQSVEKILATCTRIKEMIVLNETGSKTVPANFEQQDITIYEAQLGDEGPDFLPGGEGVKLMNELFTAVQQYNSGTTDAGSRLPIDYPFFGKGLMDIAGCVNLSTLHNLSQVQLFLLALEPKLK